MTATVPKPLTNLQYELLKFFQYEVKDNELLEIKRMLSDYFAKRAMDAMDKHWVDAGLSNAVMDEWLNDDNQ